MNCSVGSVSLSPSKSRGSRITHTHTQICNKLTSPYNLKNIESKHRHISDIETILKQTKQSRVL